MDVSVPQLRDRTEQTEMEVECSGHKCNTQGKLKTCYVEVTTHIHTHTNIKKKVSIRFFALFATVKVYFPDKGNQQIHQKWFDPLWDFMGGLTMYYITKAFKNHVGS